MHCSSTTIFKYLKLYKIKIRPHTETQKGKYNKRSKVKHHKYLKENSKITLRLTRHQHRILHQKAYHYVYYKYGKKGIDSYLKWFNKNILKIKLK